MDTITKKMSQGSQNTLSITDFLKAAAESKNVAMENLDGLKYAGVAFLEAEGLDKQLELAKKAYDSFFTTKHVDEEKTKKIINKTKGFFGLKNKAMIKATGAAQAIAAQKAKQAERNKNEAFKFGLGLITCGALFGVLMFPNMKDQFAQLIDNGKPVMDKVFAALKVLVNAAIVFIPMALGALLLWFSFSEQGPEKNGMIEKIIQASMAFLIGIEDAIFGAPKDEAKQVEASKEEQKTEETPKTEETKAMIQQRIAMLQMDLAQIAHDLA